MQYGYEAVNNEDIIAYYKREQDCHYKIVYLSGFCEEYDSLDQNEEQYIIDKMIEQAKTRDLLYYSKDGKTNSFDVAINIKAIGSFICSALCGTAAVNALADSNKTVAGAGLSFLLFGAANYAYFMKQISQKRELIKYHKFLEMLEEDEELLSKAISDAVKNYYGDEEIYYPPVLEKENPRMCINMLDFMPYSLVRKISKNYQINKNNKK